MNKSTAFLTLACAFAAAPIFGATVVKAELLSPGMNRKIPYRVVLPEGYDASTNRYPVVYLLHGANGNCNDYLGDALSADVDRFQCIAVLPDGGRTSWWFDSPVDPTYRYESFVAKELLPAIDAAYRTIPDRRHRAITGGSMGGHGAAFIAIRHKDLFGALGIVFGGVDLRPFPDNWDIKLRLGTIEEHPDYWRDYSVITQAETLKNGELDIISMIGTEDFFLGVNRNLHALWTRNKVEHIYIEMRGEDEPHSMHHGAFGTVALRAFFGYFNHFFTEGKGRL